MRIYTGGTKTAFRNKFILWKVSKQRKCWVFLDVTHFTFEISCLYIACLAFLYGTLYSNVCLFMVKYFCYCSVISNRVNVSHYVKALAVFSDFITWLMPAKATDHVSISDCLFTGLWHFYSPPYAITKYYFNAEALAFPVELIQNSICFEH